MVAFDDLGQRVAGLLPGGYSSVLSHPRLLKKSGSVGKAAIQGRLSHNLYYLMIQVIRSYQADYQLRQLTRGRRSPGELQAQGLAAGL